jgi:hypothetical protein
LFSLKQDLADVDNEAMAVNGHIIKQVFIVYDIYLFTKNWCSIWLTEFILGFGKNCLVAAPLKKVGH